MRAGKTLLGAALLMGGAFFVLAGCAGTLPRDRAEPFAALPEIVLPDVPFLPQEEDTCGPSSLAMNLGFLGRKTSTAEIMRETRTEGLRGTLITDLAASARKHGASAEVVDLDLPRLRERIEAGVPVILLVDLGTWVWSRPHYMLAFGWTRHGVVAHSGQECGLIIPFSVLDAQWAKMGRLALVVRRSP